MVIEKEVKVAKGLIICSRIRSNINLSEFFEILSVRIKPDNATVNDPYIYQEDGLFTYVYNPPSVVECRKNSFCLGAVENSPTDLFKPQSSRPDGTFALFRANDRYVEIVSDYAASRTIWYYWTESFFVASTSQRMIMAFLGDFFLDKKTLKWVLCTGTLGPGLSWDSRIKPLTPNSTILLDRTKWEITVENLSNSRFIPVIRTKDQNSLLLKNAIGEVIRALNINGSDWTLALSGGMDSRSILYFLKEKTGLNAITWGLAESSEKQGSDAIIAQKLAEMCGLPHKYATTDLDVVEFPTVLNRFLVAGEGRIDHLAGYMDGLRIWSDLSTSKRGIIRGYDALGGSRPVSNEFQARRASRLLVTTDYSEDMTPRDFVLCKDDIPETLLQKNEESLAQWRDRLWLEFRTSFITAALDDIKVAYVEIVNPLLCRRVVQVIQSLPDNARTNRILFQKIVSRMFPGVPFAIRDSVQHIDDIVGSEEAKAYIKDNLYSAKESGIIPADFLLFLVENLDKKSSGLFNIKRPRRTPMSRRILDHIPNFMQNIIWKLVVRHQPMNIQRLALRTLIIIQMSILLSEDAEAGKKVIEKDVFCGKYR